MSALSLKDAATWRWERVAPWIKAALAYDARNIPLEAIRDGFFRGQYGLIEGAESVVLFEFVSLGGRRCVHIYLAGGKMTELVDVLLPRLESANAWYGCHGAIVTGRRGWLRVLKSRGYQFLGRNSLGDWILGKDLNAATFEDHVKPMTAINYSLSPSLVAIATDTLVTDNRDWWPAFLTPKAAFLPHLDAVMTCTGGMSVMQAAYNYALTSAADDVEALAPALPAVCRQAFKESLALMRSMHPPTEDFTWAEGCAVSLFGWSSEQQRLVGLRFRKGNGFEPEPIADGVYTCPHFPNAPVSIGKSNLGELVDITKAQQEQELRKTPTDRNAIGGDILLWELSADRAGRVTSSVRKMHRFKTYDEDMAVIKERAA